MRKLIAIAIVAGLSAPALADTTVYGQLHASIDALDGATSGTTVSSNSSRIGVKGAAQLNYGLKAIYKAEWGIDTGNGGKGAFTNRNQVVGLAGRLGAVLVGRHDTPMKIVGRKADLFWSTQLGQNRNVVNPGSWDLRADNVIAYQSPKWGGFQMLAAYVTEDINNNADAFSVNGIYKAGPLMLGAAYETHSAGLNRARGQDNVDKLAAIAANTGALADITAANNAATANAARTTADALRLMASYKFGRAKIVGFYQNENDNEGATGADADVLGLGLAYKTSPRGTLKGQYYVRDNNTTNDTKMFAIGYDHKLGKKTDVYAQYADLADGSMLGGAGHGESVATDTNGDASGFSVGIRHKF